MWAALHGSLSTSQTLQAVEQDASTSSHSFNLWHFSIFSFLLILSMLTIYSYITQKNMKERVGLLDYLDDDLEIE